MDAALSALLGKITLGLLERPTYRLGRLVGLDTDGAYLVTLGGETRRVPADRRWPNPTPGSVLLLATPGALYAVAFPAAPTIPT